MASIPTIKVDSLDVPAFLYGTAWKEEDTERCVLDALKAGFRAIDTANQRKHYYEKGVGEALKRAYDEGLLTRKDLFLQTKYTHLDGQDHRLPYNPQADFTSQVQQSFASSQEHLGTQMIDSYVLHGPSRRAGLADEDWEVWRAMESLHSAGKVKVLGVSNVGLDQIKQFTEHGRVKPSFVQNRCYAQTGWDKAVRSYCREHGIVYQGFSLLTANRSIFSHPWFIELARAKDMTPAAFHIPEHLSAEDPKPFYGLRLHIKAVIDKELIKKHKSKIPSQYRKAVEKVDEVRVGYLLIPESMMIAPRRAESGPELFGATWRPIALGVPLNMGKAKFSLGTGLLITYAYVNIGDYKILDSSVEGAEARNVDKIEFRDQVTHFFRPGLDLKAELEIKFTDAFLTSFGWSSAYYVPQAIGGGFASMGMDQLHNSLWRIHQAFFMLHYRIPIKANL